MKLSIVIPVYNTRDYLPACLDSVLLPGGHDYEIVVVNDGSTDDSGAVAAEYAARCPDLIRVITTENGGLGAARNVGIEQSLGDYLLFIDSDDCLEQGVLAEILQLPDKGADIFIFDIAQVSPSGRVIGTIPGCGRNGAFTLQEYPELLFQPPSACNKLFRRSLFMESGIRFPGRVWYEDLRTIPKLYPLASRIEYIPEAWYRYLIRQGSITNNAVASRNLEILDAVQEILDEFRQCGLYAQYEQPLCYMAFYNAFLTASVRVNAIDPKSGIQETLLQWFLKTFPNYRENRYIRCMEKKHRLLTALLVNRMRHSVHMIMRLNDLARGKSR